MENILLDKKHILLCVETTHSKIKQIHISEFIDTMTNFCGKVYSELNFVDESNNIESSSIIYICGNIEKAHTYVEHFTNSKRIIKEFSWNYPSDISKYEFIGLGQIPLNVYGTGVYFKNYFNSNDESDQTNYFDLINSQHQFQILTESNKPSNAYRTGIYLSKVESINENFKLDESIKSEKYTELTEEPAYSFHLLRCSSNFDGPTDNLRETDIRILNLINDTAKEFFQSETDLNHVLAQIYHNTIEGGANSNSQKKAKIKAHSDKTKDMPSNGLMAFCTFYKDFSTINGIEKSLNDYFDCVHKNVSIFTRLRFRLKSCVKNTNNNMPKQFDIKLYPNSVFFMSLQTNRLFTHEIVPSGLEVNYLPTRMGYVIRCSKTLAISKSSKTFIREDDVSETDEKMYELAKPDIIQMETLKELYYKENMTSEIISYPKINFSFNEGDYKKPLI